MGGVPKAMYVDNGSNYSSAEFATICTRLGTVLIHTPVRDGAAKGKIERFFRTVREQFLVRDLSSIHSFAELNRQFIRWVEDTYHAREHSTLGMKPIDRFGLDLKNVRYLACSEFSDELFMLEDTRKVRADNTFSFNNLRYDRHRPNVPDPIVYQDGQRLGMAELLDPVTNDRRPLNDF